MRRLFPLVLLFCVAGCGAAGKSTDAGSKPCGWVDLRGDVDDPNRYDYCGWPGMPGILIYLDVGGTRFSIGDLSVTSPGTVDCVSANRMTVAVDSDPSGPYGVIEDSNNIIHGTCSITTTVINNQDWVGSFEGDLKRGRAGTDPVVWDSRHVTGTFHLINNN